MSKWLNLSSALVFGCIYFVGNCQALAAGTTHKSTQTDDHGKKKKVQAKDEKHDKADEQSDEEMILPIEPEFRTSSSYEQLPAGKNQPWRLVRRLQRAQDSIAAGTPGAIENYRNMLIESSEKMLKFRNQTWSHERNLDAAAIYVLIGGNPKVGKLALHRSYLGKSAKSPLKAALAFSERNHTDAYRMLNAINPTILPASLAGQFSMARAMVTSSNNLKLTAKYLKIARRLSPGTLIEEASLRRQLRITGRLKDFEEFKYLSSTYMRRFQNSYYLDDFLKAYAYALVQMPLEVSDSSLGELQNLITLLDKRQRLFVLAFVARNGTILGKTKLAYWAATDALDTIRPGSKLHTRMKLYAAASGIVNDNNTEGAAKMLNQINSDGLDKDDKKLFDAVNSLSLRLLSAPLDADQLKTILMNDQQTYPGEDPRVPIEMTKQAEFIKSNDQVIRFNKLAKNFDAIMNEVSQ